MLKTINNVAVSLVSFVLLVPLSTSQSIAEQPAVIESMALTAERLEQISAGVPGTLGYCVMSVAGETLFSRNADIQFPQASAIKIPILLEVLAQREEGKLDWDQTFRIDKSNQVAGTGVLSEFSDGGSRICVADLCVLMTVVSDNTATNLLIDLVGMENVTLRMKSLGCPHTKLQRVMLDTAASARGEENLSTPAEAARIMQLLAQGKFVNPELSDEALSILRKPKSTAIRKAVPTEIPLVSKPGAIPGVATEWALVELPENPYVIVLMGKEGQEATFLPAFTEIVQCVHQTMAGKK
jgi:beta-lactamase class A